jgi:hypothetical protein
MYAFKNGQTSVVLRVKLLDSTLTTGAGKTGLTSASTGLIISTIASTEASATVYTVAAAHINTITTLGTYAAPSASCCNFKEVDATNHPGVYEIHLADARFAVSGAKWLLVSINGVTGLAQCDLHLSLTDVDPYNRSAQFQKAMTETYNADGAAPTVEQALMLAIQFLSERSVSSTTLTVKKLDGSTTAATYTLNDATAPTSITRAS